MTPIPLKYDPGRGPFPIPRLLANVLFEPTPTLPTAKTYFPRAIADTGSPYLILPHAFHSPNSSRATPLLLTKVYYDHGERLYRNPSMGGDPVFQPFVTVGVRFLVNAQEAHACLQFWHQLTNQPAPEPLDPGQPLYSYQPQQFLQVDAYLLKPGVPPDIVTVGLDTLHEHFIFVMAGDKAFLLPRVS